jgi:hypothetical protein
MLLMLHDGKQSLVDVFAEAEELTVPVTPHGERQKAARGMTETIYTRLRNEFVHTRRGTDLRMAKAETEQHVFPDPAIPRLREST